MKRLLLVVLLAMLSGLPVHSEFRAGAAVIDVTPPKLPVWVNGGMLGRSLDKIKTRVHARALVMADDHTQVALVVVDSCMMGRVLLDDIKKRAALRTGIPAHRMLISATHAHSAPSSMGCLGTDADAAYVPFLRDQLVEAIAAAQANLEPARIGFAKADAGKFNALRQWIRRPDRLAKDPFGNLTVRANMHAGSNWDDVTGEAGPKDPDLSLISLQSRDGRPLAVLGNFSMHYFSDEDISADYFGLFSEGLRQRLAPAAPSGNPPFVGMMSHGCSGDIWRRDYTQPASAWNPNLRIEDYANGLLDIAIQAYNRIQYRDDVDVTMIEQRMALNYRVPDLQRLEWSQRIVAGMSNRPARSETEVYAREQILLHELQKTEIVLQALRVGEIAIAALPTETYAVTGLKIKAASPLPKTLVIELANGGDGYIPPPEQHLFGGYNTWPARSAGLEVQAEPKIAAASVRLLEQVTGRPRRDQRLTEGIATRVLLKSKPLAYWRLNEFAGPHAIDATSQGHDAVYENSITYYLEGPNSSIFCRPGELNRAPHFVGGRLRARLAELGNKYSLALWIWNGMPKDARPVSGWFFSRGPDLALGDSGDHLGVGGQGEASGKLILMTGATAQTQAFGKTEIPRWTWQHVVLTQDGERSRVYLNGQLEIDIAVNTQGPSRWPECFLGGRCDNDSNWEGRLDEIAIYDRALSRREIARLQDAVHEPGSAAGPRARRPIPLPTVSP